jgi:hypothetical protein
MAATVLVGLGLVVWVFTRFDALPPEAVKMARVTDRESEQLKLRSKDKADKPPGGARPESASSDPQRVQRSAPQAPPSSGQSPRNLAEVTVTESSQAQLERRVGFTEERLQINPSPPVVAPAKKDELALALRPQTPAALDSAAAPPSSTSTKDSAARSYFVHSAQEEKGRARDSRGVDTATNVALFDALQPPVLTYAAPISTDGVTQVSAGQGELNRLTFLRATPPQVIPGVQAQQPPLEVRQRTEQQELEVKREKLGEPSAPKAQLAANNEVDTKRIAARFSVVQAQQNSLAQQRPRFRRLDAPVAANAGERSLQAGLTPDWARLQNVLSSFELVQTDDFIEIRDADGSVYNGMVVSSPVTNAVDRSLVRLNREAQQAPANALAQVEQLNAQAAASFNAPNGLQNAVSFRVLGTNRSLNQMIMLDGQLTTADPAADTGLGAATQLPPPELQGGTRLNTLSRLNVPQFQLGGPNALIQFEGNLRVGTVETPIRAVQVPAE